jgi:hypothetical protein
LYVSSPSACPPSVTDTFGLNSPSDAIFGTPGTTNGTTADYILANQVGTAPGIRPYNNGIGFLTLNSFTFDVQSVNVPNAVPCPPSGTPGVCSLGDFVFTQNDLSTSGGPCPGGSGLCGHVTVSFSVNGIGYSGSSTTGSTPYTFIYSSQFNNETTTDLINKAGGPGVTNSISLTANPVPAGTVPEPVSFALLGLGLATIGIFGRRFMA